MKVPKHYKKWDVFISYSSADKEELARPLAYCLDEMGFKVWFDELTLKVGDSITEAISEGLNSSNYGIVIISRSFIERKWTRNELSALMGIEESRQNRILPVWHKVSEGQVRKFNPVIADRFALQSNKPIQQLAHEISVKLGGIKDQPIRNGVLGNWKGLSGRLRIDNFDGLLIGDYDWYGQPWAGQLKGEFDGDVFRFQWDWNIDASEGIGFFLLDKAAPRMSSIVAFLRGGWVYEADRNIIESAISCYKQYIREIYFDFQLKIEGMLSKGFNQWDFAQHDVQKIG